MAVSDQQKIDFLLKKIGFTKTKTGSTVGSGAISGTPKQPFAEALPSPLVVPNSSLWNEADSIPATPPGSDTSQVKVYATSSAVRMTADATSSGQRAYIAYSTYNNTSSARLTNWIDTQFGALYLIKVYKGDPNSGGVALSSGATNENWFFDYSAGVLNFNDSNVPSGVTDTNIYIVGYRYIGQTGAPTSGISTFSFLDLTVERNFEVGGISTFHDAIKLKEDATSGSSTKRLYIGAGDDLRLFHDSTNSYVQNHTGDLILGDTNHQYFRGNTSDKSVSLYFNGAEKVKTTSLGVSIGGTAIITSASGGELGIGTDNPSEILHIANSGNPKILIEDTDSDNQVGIRFKTTNYNWIAGVHGGIDSFKISHSTAFGSNDFFVINGAGIVSIIRDLDVDGHTNLDNISVSGVSTFTGDATFAGNVSIGGTLTYEDVINVDSVGIITARAGIDCNADLDVDGHTNLDNVSIAGVTTATGNIHAQARIGIGINNPTQQFHIYGSGSQNALIQSTTDDIIRLQLKNSSRTYNLENITGGTFRIRDGYTNTVRLSINNAGNTTVTGNLNVDKDLDVDGHTNLDNVSIAGVTTMTGMLRIDSGNLQVYGTAPNIFLRDTNDNPDYRVMNSHGSFKIFDETNGVDRLIINPSGKVSILYDLDVDGHTNLDNVSVAGVTTFAGVIEGVAGENKIPSLYSAMTNLPSAGSYHGMFAHVHATGRGYFAHAGNWLELVNKETNGIVGTGTETYSIGHITGTGLILNGDIDVDGHTNLDNVSVAGVTTFSDRVNIAGGKDLQLLDNGVIRLGNDSNTVDFQMFHDGGHTRFNNATGNIYINNSSTNGSIRLSPKSGENGLIVRYAGAVQAYHSNTKRIETTSTGAIVTGILTATDLDIDGHTNLDNVSITGVSTFASQVRVAGQLQLDSTLKAGGSTGTNGQYLRTTGAGVTWASFPTMRTSQTFTASAGQTTFNFTYNIGYLDVYVNGVKLSSSEFTANNGSSVVLAVGSFVGDIVELISFFTTSYAAGSDTGIENLVEDTSPQLGGNLDLFNKFITGTGGVSITGVITATSFSGTVPSSSLSGALPALDGSALTGIVASGSGVVVKNSGSTVGTAGTIDFGNNLSVSPISAGIVTITGAAGGGSGISTISGVVNIANDLSVAGVTTFSENVNIIRSSGFGALTIQGGESTNASINLKADDGDNNGDHWQIKSVASDNDFVIANDSTGSLVEKLAIATDGTVSITNKLQITGNSTEINFVDSNNNPDYRIIVNGGKFRVQNTTNGNADVIEVLDTGNVNFDNGITVGLDLDVDGHTNLDNVSVVGVTTFSSAITVSDIRNDSINLRNASGGASYATFTNGGAAVLKWNNTDRLETTTSGITVTGTVNATAFSGDGSALSNLPGISTTHVRSETLTVSGVTTFTGDVNANKLKFADSNGSSTNIALFGADEDLKIYHSGADSFISDQGTGQLKILTSTLSVKNAGDSTVGLEVVPGSHTKLFFNGSNKIETTNTGAVVTGALTANSFVGDGSGLTNVVGSGSGVIVKDDGSTVGTAGTFDFTSPINITPLSAGITTVGIDTNQFNVNNLDVSGISTFAGNISLAEKIVHTDDTNTSINFPSLDTISFITGGGTRLQVGPVGQLGIAGATYGNPGQVLTSQGSGTIVTWADPPNNIGITTNITGSFTATAGSPSEIHSFVYGNNDRVVEYTILIEQGPSFQSLKVLASRLGSTIHSTQFAVIFNNSLLATFDVIISSSNIRLRAIPETGVTGTIAYRIKREVM